MCSLWLRWFCFWNCWEVYVCYLWGCFLVFWFLLFVFLCIVLLCVLIVCEMIECLYVIVLCVLICCWCVDVVVCVLGCVVVWGCVWLVFIVVCVMLCVCWFVFEVVCLVVCLMMMYVMFVMLLLFVNVLRFGMVDACDVYYLENVDDVMMVCVVCVVMLNYFKDFGGWWWFYGEVMIVLCYENNFFVWVVFEELGRGRVFVVDGGASTRCALLGDNLVEMVVMNGWSGIIVNGCVCDSEDIVRFDVGVKVIGMYSLKSSKRDSGRRDARVSFVGVDFELGSYVYVDVDGVVVVVKKLEL